MHLKGEVIQMTSENAAQHKKFILFIHRIIVFGVLIYSRNNQKTLF